MSKSIRKGGKGKSQVADDDESKFDSKRAN